MIKNQTIFIVYANMFASLYGRFARYLRDEHDIQSVLIVQDASVLKTLEKHDFHEKDFLDIVEIGDSIVARDLSKISVESLSAEVRELEEKLSIPLTEIIRADRHLGKNFVTGAEYPRSLYGVNTTYDQSVDIVVRLAKQMFGLVDKYKPMALITIPGNIFATTAINVCKFSSVPLMAPFVSRARNAICWAMDKSYTPYGLKDLYEEELSRISSKFEDDDTASELDSYDRAKKAISEAPEKASYKGVIKSFYKILKSKAGDIYYNRSKKYGNYFVTDKLMEIYLLRKEWRQELRQSKIMDQLDTDRKYVFFPLHVEPESSMLAESPMADNQLSCIDLLAKSIPSDWRIIVKEHPALYARRPKGFWERITRYPNVLKANIHESSDELFHKAEVVAVINSTVGYQAAVAGRFVLSFHPGFHAHYLPHVKICRSYEEAQAAFKYFVSDRVPSKIERKRHGAAYLAALSKMGTPINDDGLIMGRAFPKPVEWLDVKSIADGFLKTLSIINKQMQ